jgi:hypothetical protein
LPTLPKLPTLARPFMVVAERHPDVASVPGVFLMLAMLAMESG